jgi:hypothetical protein
LLPVRKCERAYDDQHKTRIARFREKATAFCCVPGNFGFIQLKPESATPLERNNQAGQVEPAFNEPRIAFCDLL